MVRLLRHFWATLGFATAFLGLLLIPNDVADSRQAIAWWSAQLTPSNREIILATLLAIFGSRIAYVDIQGALNSREWKPLRQRFTTLLGVAFKKDKRIAELMKLGNDKDITLLRQSLQAKIFLDSLNWQPIVLPVVHPYFCPPDPEGAPPGTMYRNTSTSYDHLIRMEMRRVDAEVERKLSELKMPGLMTSGDIQRLIEGEVAQCSKGAEIRQFIRDLNVPTQAVADAIASTYCRVKGANRAIQAAHAHMSHLERQWQRVSLAPETLEQLRADIEVAEHFTELAPQA